MPRAQARWARRRGGTRPINWEGEEPRRREGDRIVYPSYGHYASSAGFRELRGARPLGGGSICDRCRVEGTVKLRDGITEYLAALADSEVTGLPPVDPGLSAEAMGIARRFVEYHLDRKLTSLAVME